MRPLLTYCALGATLVTLTAALHAQARGQGEVAAPETFVANAQATSGQGATVAASVTIQINMYTSETDRNRIQEALRTGGYPGFLPALRRAPEVGFVEGNGRKVAVRWARQIATPKGRTISIVTDNPIVFLGGASPDAKPRAGYEVGVIQMEVDSVGLGTGTMAGAARVRPGGETGVQIDDYADTPIKLTSVRKSYK